MPGNIHVLIVELFHTGDDVILKSFQ